MFFLEEVCKRKIQSPKKTSTFLKSVQLSILHKFVIRLPVPVFPVIQANLQLVSARSYWNLLYIFGSDLLAQSTESQDAQINNISKSIYKHS